MIDKAGEMTRFAVAECERCAGKWLMETDVEPDLLEGICWNCQSDSDTEKLLTFRMPNLKKIKAFQSLLAFSKIPKA